MSLADNRIGGRPPAVLVWVMAAAAILRDRAALGLVVRPAPSVRYWIGATLVIAAFFLIVVMAAALYVLLTDGPVVLHYRGWSWWDRIRITVLEGPAVEEVIYRAAILTGLVPALRVWPAIIVSAIAFGYLHVYYGNPAPNNLIAGVFFGWAYLRSGTLIVPLVLHALGNLCVVVLNHVGTLVLG